MYLGYLNLNNYKVGKSQYSNIQTKSGAKYKNIVQNSKFWKMVG